MLEFLLRNKTQLAVEYRQTDSLEPFARK